MTTPQAPQHDTCGARLLLTDPAGISYFAACALGPHGSDTYHHAAGGTRWRATDLAERGEALARYRNALARTGPCCCPEHVYATIDGAADGDREMDPLCPKHGIVAELARQLAWAHSFTARIMAALPDEWSEPFHGGDAAAEIVQRLERSKQAEREHDAAVGWLDGLGVKIAEALNMDVDTIAEGTTTETLLDELIEAYRERGMQREGW